MAKTKKPQNRGLFLAALLAGGAIFAFIAHQQWGGESAPAPADNAGVVAADEKLLDRFEGTNAAGRAFNSIVQPAPTQPRPVSQARPPQTPEDFTNERTRANAARGAIVGLPAVVSANSFVLNGRQVVLWGIAVPDARVPCRTGSVDWYCGEQSLTALRRALGRNEVACFDKGTDHLGRMVGKCVVGLLDLGAQLVGDGWAIADTEVTRAYTAEESDAKFKKRGIWTGTFDRRTFVGAGG
ncbi:thermonuclease family protein [Rhodanobacter denitrificans]|uniref:thermonuclease family protein n=1 Tax=Rhodanobacter denitrificans TaxID=666685 RepID=UPI001F1E6BF5|nr:thermonuclease family protein [Rhodanobacter denitrificans]UJJ60401.1 thermonuclease family protein [Rhodanobacter denitrificans]